MKLRLLDECTAPASRHASQCAHRMPHPNNDAANVASDTPQRSGPLSPRERGWGAGNR